ncbi:MAG: cellulase, partial [Clostridiaceae bacterium]|nr:cellulase [Clostridiaceae bacterium]
MTKKICITVLAIIVFLASQVVSFAGELLGKSTFEDKRLLPWQIVCTEPARADFKIINNQLHVKVLNSGSTEQRWDIQLQHKDIMLESDHTYTVEFTVTADRNCKVYARIGDHGDPYYEDWNIGNRSFTSKQLNANQPWTCSETFTATRTKDNCNLSFYLGGEDMPQGTTLIFDDIHLEDPDYTPPTPTATPELKGIRINQLGYYPDLDKKATLLSDSSTPLTWQLLNEEGTVVSDGKTNVFGMDKDSGDNVHIIDFSSFKETGTGYKLVSGSLESYSFDISPSIYSNLKKDAFKYFYHKRSGINIAMPYCVDPQWARPAENPEDIVPCEIQNDNDLDSWAPYSSNHLLDIKGGWYFDEYEHSKKSIGSGVAVWLMQNYYERSKYTTAELPEEDMEQILNIPESENDYPDILDEARYNLECMINMQVPQGYPRAGMVHAGTDEYIKNGAAGPEVLREMQPPTTECTLNLAAVAAQGSRLWKEFDPEFAAKCLKAAETAWLAANNNPEIYLPQPDGVGNGYALDDFYWAACELYATTGSNDYLTYIKQSDAFLKVSTRLADTRDLEEGGAIGSFDMNSTDALGTLTLTLVPTSLGDEYIQTAKDNISIAADFYLDLQKNQGYGVPYQQCYTKWGSSEPGYQFLSNNLILNNAIIMAYAYDYSNNAKYINGVAGAMDYILGRNPNVKSYVTGYGENPV